MKTIMRFHSLFLLFFLVLTAACNSAVQSVPVTQVPELVQTPLVMETVLPQVTASATTSATPTPTSTNTPTQTPSFTATLIPPPATFDSIQATSAYLLGSAYYRLTVPQQSLFNPVGTPLKSWYDTPILPQATVGQEFSVNAYSYKAAATIDQAQQFYASYITSSGIIMNPLVVANGINIHYSYFESYDLTIYFFSYDQDPSHVIVAIFRIPY